MSTIEWTPALEVGVADIDDDHRVMVALLNRVVKAVDRMQAVAVLEELGRCTAEHFAREEELMAACCYEFADRHRREHRELYREIRHQIDDLLAGERKLPEIGRFMQQWLLRHIALEDRLLGQVLGPDCALREAIATAG